MRLAALAVLFGIPVLNAVSAPPAVVSSAVHSYFSDQGSIQAEVLKLIDSAKVEILVNQHCFTNPEFAKALLRAKTERRVLVYVLLDPDPGLVRYATPFALNSAGVTVRLSTNPGHNLNRYMVVDAETVAIGSYEWTLASERQSEAALTIIPDPATASEYIEHFRRAMGKAVAIEKKQPADTNKP